MAWFLGHEIYEVFYRSINHENNLYLCGCVYVFAFYMSIVSVPE